MVEHPRTGWVDGFNWGLSRVTMVLPAVIVAVMIIEVVARYVFEKPTLWANELSLWLAGMAYLFAGLYAMQQRSHIRITLFYDASPRWLRRTFDCIGVALLWVFAFAVIWGGYGEAYKKLMRWETFGTAWDPPIPATMKPLILLTVAVIALQALSNLIHDWNVEPENHGPVEDDEVATLRSVIGDGAQG